MNIERDLLASRFHLEACAVGIGTFDGVHRGHRRLIEEVLERGRAAGIPTALLTFDPHPHDVIRGVPVPRLTTLDEKLEILAGTGLDHTILVRFTPEFAHWEPVTFVERVLRDHLGAREVVVGFNFTFGNRGRGTPATLEELSHTFGYRVDCIQPVEYEGTLVSSTEIRNRLFNGRIAEANQLMSRPYILQGRVAKGEGRGRRIGFPTANIQPGNPLKIVPPRGVYRCEIRHSDGKTYPALVNIGINPTFHGEGSPLKIEAYVHGFEGDLVDTTVRLSFLERFRDEKKFAGVEALVAQIKADVSRLEEILEGELRR